MKEQKSMIITMFITLTLLGFGGIIHDMTTNKHHPFAFVPAEYDVDPAFQKYVNQFTVDAIRHNVTLDMSDLVIKFFKIEQKEKGLTTLGRCWVYSHNTPTIEIHPKFWHNMDDMKRKMLIYHELGHCKLKRRHTPNNVISIMHRFVLPNHIHTDYYDYLITELFTNLDPKYMYPKGYRQLKN